MVEDVLGALPPGMRASAAFNIASNMSRGKVTQDKVQAMIAEDIKTNPAAGAAALKDSTFQGPAGFSNVVGVGANPVLQYMTRQTDIQQEILEILKQNRANEGEGVPAPWTERLKLNQIGIT